MRFVLYCSKKIQKRQNGNGVDSSRGQERIHYKMTKASLKILKKLRAANQNTDMVGSYKKERSLNFNLTGSYEERVYNR